MSVLVRVVFDRFPDYAKATRTACTDAADDLATQGEKRAAELAPRRSGYMASSVYKVSARGSSYGGVAGDRLLPSVPKPSGDTNAVFAVGAYYAVFVEFGTRFMSAIPFFMPAVMWLHGQVETTVAKWMNTHFGKVAR